MTSLTRRHAARFALGFVLLASACQHDSDADFDDSGLMSPGTGAAGSGVGATDAGGSDAAAAGVDSGGSSSGGGTKPSAGNTSQGGKASAGASGNPTVGGKGGSTSGGGGKAGTDTGGTTAQAGKAGQSQGGMAGSTTAGGGMGGSVVTPPEPMTFETADIDDTQVGSCTPNMNYGALPTMNVDGDKSCSYAILIIAPLSGIPAGAVVSDATLTLTCTNAGDAVTVSYVNEAWKELTVHWSSRPEVGTALGTTTCSELGKVTIDLTAAVKAWLAGDHEPYGIYLRTEGTDGTDYATSEAEPMSSRPKFSVTYTLPAK